MPLPTYEDLMLPILRRFADGKEHDNRSLYEDMAREFGLTESELDQKLPSGTYAFSNRFRWALVYLTNAGLLVQLRRGLRKLAPDGAKVLARKPDRIDTKLLGEFEAFNQFRKRENTDDQSVPVARAELLVASATPDELLERVFATAQEPKRAEILKTVLSRSPKGFEQLVLEVLKAAGYGGGLDDRVSHLGKTADGGVDGAISEDALGLGKIYVQAKRYAPDHAVDVDAVRAFAGSLDEFGSKKGVFITTSSFTRAARDFSTKIRDKKIALIDGNDFVELMMKYGVGVRLIRSYELKGIDLDYFADEEV